MKLKAINYKLLKFLHLDQNDHLISLDRIKDVVFRAFLYMQLFHVFVLVIIAFSTIDQIFVFLGSALYKIILNGVFLFFNGFSEKIYKLFISINLAVLLASNLILEDSSLIGLAISIYTFTILALILVDVKFMLLTTVFGTVTLITDVFLEYIIFSDVASTKVLLFELNDNSLFLYGHLLFYILITMSLYFYLDKIRIRKIEKLLSNRTKLINYLQNLNTKLSNYAFYHSHELRAPVSRALGLNELLLNIYKIDNKEVESLIHSLNDSVFQIDRIIRTMNLDLEEIPIYRN